MSLRAIQTDVHLLILNARRIERLIKTPTFETFFNHLLIKEREEVIYLIKTLNFIKVSEWFEARLIKDIGELSYRELRTKASRLCIPGYSLLSKEQLIREIIKHDTRRNDYGDRSETGQHGQMEGDSETSLGEVSQTFNQIGISGNSLPLVHGLALSAIGGSPCVS